MSRVLSLLNDLVSLSGRTKSSLERELGLSSGYLSRILGRTDDIALSHLLPILEALGVTPGDFFRSACPQPAGPAASRSLLARLGSASESELDEKVLRALGRLLQSAGRLEALDPAREEPLPAIRKARRKPGSDPARSG